MFDKKSFIYFFLISFLLLSSSAFAAAGYGYNGHCYASNQDVVTAFLIKDLTRDNELIKHEPGPYITEDRWLNWSTWSRGTKDGVWVNRNGMFPLYHCELTADQFPIQSLLLIFSLFFAAVFGFRTGYGTSA